MRVILRFVGEVVDQHDWARVGECGCDEDCSHAEGSIHVGGRDVVREIHDQEWSGHVVTVAIADARFTGDLAVDLGWGYSEWTPMDPDELRVGDHDLLEILKRHEGQQITLWVADEPVNTLDP